MSYGYDRISDNGNLYVYACMCVHVDMHACVCMLQSTRGAHRTTFQESVLSAMPVLGMKLSFPGLVANVFTLCAVVSAPSCFGSRLEVQSILMVVGCGEIDGAT